MSTPNKDVLVIGIDFGTTHSGAAWCLSSDPGTMKIVNSWPGGASDGIRASGQVPSVISYSQRDISKHRWGFEVQPETPNQLAWFKLLLNQYAPSSITAVRKEPNHALMTSSALKLLQSQMELDRHLAKTMKSIPAGKTPVDVVADYMRELVHHTNNALRDTYKQSLVSQLGNSIPIHYVLTVPAVWSDKAKALTLKAAKSAGMNNGQRSVRLISEPEAAAMHCLRFYQDSQNCLRVGDIYVVADCGGGTVDLISYEITAISPKLKVKECVAGTGGMCGSTSLNRKFMSLLQERLGPEQWAKQSPRNLAAVEKRFDSIKRNFIPTDTDDEDDFDDEDNLIFIPVPGVADNRVASIENGELLLTQKDMISIFVPTFDQITSLVKEQVNAAQDRSNKSVTGILLVGGFGESKYLKKYLSDKVTAEFRRDIQVLQPIDAWSAIVRGAVHDGLAVHQTGELNNGMLESRRARYSYGVPCSLPFVPGVHPVENRYFDKLTCQFYCRGGMSWFIKKNQELVCGEPIKLEMESNLAENYTDDALIQVQSVMVCDSEDPPELREDGAVESLLVFTNNFKSQKSKFVKKTSPITREPFWCIPIDSVLRYDSAELKFSTEMLGKKVGTAPSVSYSHAVPGGGASGGVRGEIEW